MNWTLARTLSCVQMIFSCLRKAITTYLQISTTLYYLLTFMFFLFPSTSHPRLPEKFIASSETWSSHHHQENYATLFTPILII